MLRDGFEVFGSSGTLNSLVAGCFQVNVNGCVANTQLQPQAQLLFVSLGQWCTESDSLGLPQALHGRNAKFELCCLRLTKLLHLLVSECYRLKTTRRSDEVSLVADNQSPQRRHVYANVNPLIVESREARGLATYRIFQVLVMFTRMLVGCPA